MPLPNSRPNPSGVLLAAAGLLTAALTAGACRIDPPTAHKAVVLAPGQRVVAVDPAWFGSAATLDLAVSGTAGKRLVGVKLNAGEAAVAAEKTGWFKLTSPYDPEKPPVGIPLDAAASASRRPVRLDPGPRRAEAGRALAPPQPAESRAVGTTVQVQLYLDWSAAARTVTAEVVYANAACNVLVYPRPGAAGAPAWVASAVAAADLVADAQASIVGPRVDGLFAGTAAPAVVDIVLFDIDSDYYDGQAHGIFGYFTASYPDQVCLDGGFLSAYPYSAVSTLAHEYQHLLSARRYPADAPSTFVEELRALAVEDLLEPDFSAAYGTSNAFCDGAYDFYFDGPFGRAETFLADYAFSGLPADDTAYDADFGLDDYAFASMFGAFLLRNYGGAPFLADWIAAGPGSAALAAATPSTADTASGGFGQYLEPFVYALFGLDAAGAAVPPLAASDVPATLASDPTQRSLRTYPPAARPAGNDHYAIPAWLADGPIPYGAGEIVGLPPFAFSVHANELWRGLDPENVELSLCQPASASVRFLLFVLD
jgi:hypothetical protein